MQRVDDNERLSEKHDALSVVRPTVSIIIPTFNCRGTVEKAIQSVLCQGYAQKELVIVDGGSSDGTIDVLRKYDDFINCWVSEPDEGIYDAMNKGVNLSGGDWLYFLGGDDRLFNNQVLENIFSIPPTGQLIYGNVLWGENGCIYAGEFSKYKLMWENISHQAIFYHRDLFAVVGPFDVNYPVLADWAFNIKSFGRKNTNQKFVDTVVAVFGIDGLSTSAVDAEFVKNKIRLIMSRFGIHYWFIYRFVKFFRFVKVHLKKVRNSHL